MPHGSKPALGLSGHWARTLVAGDRTISKASFRANKGRVWAEHLGARVTAAQLIERGCFAGAKGDGFCAVVPLLNGTALNDPAL